MVINKKLTLIFLFLMAVGICTGSFFEVFMKGEGKQQLMDMMSGFFAGESTQSFSTAFFGGFKTWLIILVVLFACPLFPPLCALCPLIPLIKGLTLGFSATMLVETFGLKGGWYIISTMLPHSLIQIPVLCVLAAVSLECALVVVRSFIQKKRRSINKNALQSYARQYLVCYGAGVILIIASCMIEAFLN